MAIEIKASRCTLVLTETQGRIIPDERPGEGHKPRISGYANHDRTSHRRFGSTREWCIEQVGRLANPSTLMSWEEWLEKYESCPRLMGTHYCGGV